MGMLYKPKYKAADGTIKGVRPVRESTGTTKEKAARSLG